MFGFKAPSPGLEQDELERPLEARLRVLCPLRRNNDELEAKMDDPELRRR